MLDVIVYEDEEVSIKKNRKIIQESLKYIDYRINVFKEYNEELIKIIHNKNRKLYIISLEAGNYQGLNLAVDIRKQGLDDIVILTANCAKYYDTTFNNRLLAFDYICKNTDYDKRLMDAISEAGKILTNNQMFIFKYNHVIYRIPFKNINYIEKETNIKRCIIHTCNKESYIVSSIDKLANMLKLNFIKTHQSCIVNLDNIKILDCINNKIVFENDDYTTLLTEHTKREIKKWLFTEQC